MTPSESQVIQAVAAWRRAVEDRAPLHVRLRRRRVAEADLGALVDLESPEVVRDLVSLGEWLGRLELRPRGGVR